MFHDMGQIFLLVHDHILWRPVIAIPAGLHMSP
jgi:hypothetical protein